MRVPVYTVYGKSQPIIVERADSDGDVYLDMTDVGCYINVPTVRRLIAALRRAAKPKRKTRQRPLWRPQ